MRLLLDTQIALWALTGSARLGALTQPLRLLSRDATVASYGAMVMPV